MAGPLRPNLPPPARLTLNWIRCKYEAEIIHCSTILIFSEYKSFRGSKNTRKVVNSEILPIDVNVKLFLDMFSYFYKLHTRKTGRRNAKLFSILFIFSFFWKCNFPINHNVCLSVCQKKWPNYLNVRVLGKCFFFYFFLKTPPLKQTHNNFDRQWGGGVT